MANATMRALQYKASRSVNAARSVLLQANFLQDMLQKLETDPDSVLSDLKAYRDARTYFLVLGTGLGLCLLRVQYVNQRISVCM